MPALPALGVLSVKSPDVVGAVARRDVDVAARRAVGGLACLDLDVATLARAAGANNHRNVAAAAASCIAREQRI